MSENFQDRGLDKFVNKLLEGVVIPVEYKKKKKKSLMPIRDVDLLSIAFSTGRAAYTTILEVDGKVLNVSFTQHELRVWVNGNWNTDTPTLKGEVVRASIDKVLEEIRVRRFLTPEQVLWLTHAFSDDEALGEEPPDAEGAVPADSRASLEWITELHTFHDLITPDEGLRTWVLTPYGREIRQILLRSIPPADRQT